MKADGFITKTERYCAHNYHPLSVVISRGEGVWVWDVDDHKYMDMLSSYSALNQGHTNKRILDALIKQAKAVPLTSRAFFNDKLGDFAELLCTITRKDKILPMNSGAEAVETALKIARKWGCVIKKVPDGKQHIIACRNNFHGRTITIVGMSTEEQYRHGFGPFSPGFSVVEFGNAKALEKEITPDTVAFIVEPIQGEGGVIVPPEGYLKEVASICRKHNVLFIADEVQTGLARTGRMFACDHENVAPDMYVLGKALSGGFYPVSAVAANDDIMGVITPGDHGSTFGGNPLAAAVGVAALQVIIDENLADRAAKSGAYFMNELRKLKSPHVSDVRGKGLLIGVDIKKKSGKAMDFCYKLKDAGLLCKDTRETTIRFAPALTITRGEIDWALKRISKILK